MKSKIHYTVRELQPKVDELAETGIQRGALTGFNCLDELYSVKLGCTTYIMGSPYSGKTEFWLEILMNLSESKGWRHVIFTPETGTKEEIVAELCHKKVKKGFFKNSVDPMSDKERYDATTWLNEHFFIVDPADAALTISDYFKIVDTIENENGIIVHTTTIDPFNEMAHDFSKDEGRQDLYIERVLGDIRKNARATQRHNCVITHCRDQAPITRDGMTYYPPPTARDYAGGQAWFRKGLSMIAVWRPPVGLPDTNGIPFEENESHIIIQKSKPKGTGKRGTAKLFWDYKKSRYYERSEVGTDMYAFDSKIVQDMPANTLKPNTNFYEVNKEDNPF